MFEGMFRRKLAVQPPYAHCDVCVAPFIDRRSRPDAVDCCGICGYECPSLGYLGDARGISGDDMELVCWVFNPGNMSEILLDAEDYANSGRLTVWLSKCSLVIIRTG